jgi:hypothetical protein
MARDRLTFRQRDLNTALKVAQARGLKIARIEVSADGIVIIPTTNGETPAQPETEDAKTQRKMERAAEIAKRL